MRGFNQCVFLGNLGQDAEIKQTPGGQKVASISLACGYSVKNGQTGEWEDRTEWVRCVVWNPSDWLAGQMKKGRPMHVSGRLQTRSWDDQNGAKRYMTEVICNASGVIPANPIRNDQQGQPPAQAPVAAQQAAPAYPASQYPGASGPSGQGGQAVYRTAAEAEAAGIGADDKRHPDYVPF